MSLDADEKTTVTLCCVTAGLLLVVGIGVVLGIVLGFSMLAVAVTIIKRYTSSTRCSHGMHLTRPVTTPLVSDRFSGPLRV